MKAGDWLLAAIIVWASSYFITEYVELPIVQIGSDGECVQVLHTDEFGCGFLPDKYIVEHVQ